MAKLHKASLDRIVAFALAIHIPVLLWLGTSYLIARSIFSLTFAVSVAIAFASAALIYLVERLVIATPSSWIMWLLRLGIASIVAVLGATTVDLVVFEKEIAETLILADEARIADDYDKRIQKQQEIADRRERGWKSAEAQATCEADGTCGTRQRNLGPIYAQKKRLADQARADFEKEQAELERLQQEKIRRIQAVRTTDQSIQNAGLLARFEALHRYVTDHKAAFVAWLHFLVLMVCMEMLVVMVKVAFRETVDDKLERIREQVSESKGNAYFNAVKAPALGARELLTSTYRSN